ncbi:hypothetical protein TNCV_987161 [Trichonephila clavipes]|nr:hypothetical protein TNCV_987161 [Trichonephila clavipes]
MVPPRNGTHIWGFAVPTKAELLKCNLGAVAHKEVSQGGSRVESPPLLYRAPFDFVDLGEQKTLSQEWLTPKEANLLNKSIQKRLGGWEKRDFVKSILKKVPVFVRISGSETSLNLSRLNCTYPHTKAAGSKRLGSVL